MRIAIFTDTFLPQVNGVTNTLSRFGDFLRANGHEHLFITPEQNGMESTPYHIESFFSAPFFLYPECRFTLPNMGKLTKKLADFQPDIIFLMTEFNMGLTGLMYGKKHNIPVVSNYSTNFGTILKAYNLWFLEKSLEKYLLWFHNEAQLTVTPSLETKTQLLGKGIKRVALFSRGIDEALFSPKKRSDALRAAWQADGKTVLLYVGRLSYEKDLFLLIEGMRYLNAQYRDEVLLVITGEGPMMNHLKQEMPENVIFTGYKKDEALAEIYASADAFVFPSSFETFGNVVLEAYASGLPVLGVNEGGVKNLIVHNESGYLAKPRDSQSFNHYLSNMMQPAIRKTFALRGMQLVKARSWQSVFEQLIALFDSIIISHREAEPSTILGKEIA
ncbi:glycosyltransferase family 1 protein [Fusibacter paucivorans]|uniref:Glycosyltransferase family 1 protein n=1 Tax=Fusibacter paucivorans TaxID=76009 RepID=A0ABS5PK70_9FIRM|nr:glycosyltransferase family 1 protein [Fusibacter paucivorans]MBS7525267.1 glycosyltransferase family 1 protein [Fusibacter paucivorans]